MPPVRASKPAALPDNPKWLTIDHSDGDPKFWPKNTEQYVDNAGNVNYMEPLDIDHGLSIKWRRNIGQKLAEMLGLPDKESKTWVLKDWPAGYHFYDHHKGPLGNERHDLYLIGSKHVNRFRSPPEFIPHAYWLIKDQGVNRDACQCKYCGKGQQREITEALGLSHRTSNTAQYVELPRADKLKRRKLRAMKEDRISGVMRRIPRIKEFPKGPSQHSLPERENDLRAFLGVKAKEERRWAREGELVWVKLDHPIQLGHGEDEEATIRFWPGLVDEVQFRPRILTKPAGDANMDVQTPPPDDDPFSGSTWTVVPTSVYKIQLLTSTKTVLASSDSILPYQARAPSRALLTTVSSVLFDVDDPRDDPEDALEMTGNKPSAPSKRLRRRFQDFDPCPADSFKGPTIQERIAYNETAAGSYAWSIDTAAQLTQFWTPTNSWTFMMMNIPDSSLSMLISEGTIANDQQNLSKKLLGTPDNHSVQKRFQGLWWGPERIWCGDLVRLKISRDQFVPGGNEIVKAPWTKRQKGKGKAVDDGSADVEMYDGELPGSPSRSLFMGIDSIFVAEIPKEGTAEAVNECRMSGMLYELVDEDWSPGEDDALDVHPAEIKPGSSTLFAPNPELLSELPTNINDIVSDVAGPSADIMNLDAPLPPSVTNVLASASEQLLNLSKSDLASHNSKIKLPSRPPYPAIPLPPPPAQLKFRPILKEGHEVVFPLTQLAGRYYPSILTQPLLQDGVREALEDFNAPESKLLWALDGRMAGIYNAVDPVHFLPRRSRMAQVAETNAWDSLTKHWKEGWRRNEAQMNAIVID